MRLYLQSVANDLLANLDDRIQSISFFNFENGKVKIDLTQKSKLKIGSQGITWIRAYLPNNLYYDFITSSVTYFLTKTDLIVIVNDDAQFVDSQFIANLINDMLIKEGEIETHGSEEAIKNYYQRTSKQLKEAEENLSKIYTFSKQQHSSRLKLEDSFKAQKDKIEKNYILGLMVRQIINENKEEIVGIL